MTGKEEREALVANAYALREEWQDRTDAGLPLSERAPGVGVVDALITGDRIALCLTRLAAALTAIESLSPGAPRSRSRTMASPTPTMSDEIVEILAAVEHERWARWQSWVHAASHRNADGSLTIPASLVERWERQIATRYDKLSEAEKESDRTEARATLTALLTASPGAPSGFVMVPIVATEAMIDAGATWCAGKMLAQETWEDGHG